jgi:hypothetical protein
MVSKMALFFRLIQLASYLLLKLFFSLSNPEAYSRLSYIHALDQAVLY